MAAFQLVKKRRETSTQLSRLQKQAEQENDWRYLNSQFSHECHVILLIQKCHGSAANEILILWEEINGIFKLRQVFRQDKDSEFNKDYSLKNILVNCKFPSNALQ